MMSQPMPCGRLLSARLLDTLAILALPVAVVVCFVIASLTTDNGPQVLAPYPGEYSHAHVERVATPLAKNPSEK